MSTLTYRTPRQSLQSQPVVNDIDSTLSPFGSESIRPRLFLGEYGNRLEIDFFPSVFPLSVPVQTSIFSALLRTWPLTTTLISRARYAPGGSL